MQYRNEFLDAYMQLVEETESPRTHHLWSALTGISACLGRRCWLPFGTGPIYPNIYTLLVGPAGARKSTAMNIMVKILRRHTGVRLAPQDTSGKRQGLASAMSGEDEDPDIEEMKKQINGVEQLTPELLGGLVVDLSTTRKLRQVADADKHTMLAASSEFNNFIGHGNIEFLEFLARMYDGDAYDYRLKDKKHTLTMDDPLLTLIGCTTSTNIATAFPEAAIGQGFTSRVIFVYGPKIYKEVPRPPEFDNALEQAVGQVFANVYYGLHGAFRESDDARDFANSIYNKQSEVTDGRFANYLARRQTHFLKVGMLMAAARGSSLIQLRDYEDSDILLRTTERTMPDALGEYGMSIISAAKQKILEYVRFAREPVTTTALWNYMARDLRQHELSNCINDLLLTRRIQSVRRAVDNATAYIPIEQHEEEVLQLMDTYANAASTETVQ